jgi:hypothetical protein
MNLLKVCDSFENLPMLYIKFGVRAGAASRYGFCSTKIMRLRDGVMVGSGSGIKHPGSATLILRKQYRYRIF